MIKPGIVSATFKAQSPDYVLSMMERAELYAVEWSEKWHIPAGDTKAAAALRAKTLAQGAEIAAYGSYYRLGQNKNPAEDFLPSIENAVALQAPLIRIWGGGVPSAELDDDTREKLVYEARIVCDIARSYGVKVALEWHKNTVTDTNGSARDFLDAVGSENLYCLWQPTVALNMEERCAGIEMLERKNRLLNLHVYYWLEGKRCPFSEGLTEWRQYLSCVDPSVPRFGLLEFVMNDAEEQFLADAVEWKQLLRDTDLICG